jgi:hypothetical protein
MQGERKGSNFRSFFSRIEMTQTAPRMVQFDTDFSPDAVY